MSIPYTVTNDTVTVIIDGRPSTVKRGAPNYMALRDAVLKGYADDVVRHHLRADTSLEKWARGKFTVVDNHVHFDGKPVPSEINSRITEMAAAGEDPTPLFLFWEKLQRNPSHRSVQQLYTFLKNTGIPLTSDGSFLAYKSVRSDFKDVHSGTISNHVGAVVTMPRNQISDDPNEACHVGLHVGALEYASSFGGDRIVICKVDPADVVCVPFDASFQKMRTCRYEVIGLHGSGHMQSTTIPDEDWDVNDDDGDLDDDAWEDGWDALGDGLKPAAPPAPAAPKEKRSKEFRKLDSLSESELMGESVETLRRYASKGMKVVGAYRIPGGKFALVQAIVSARHGGKSGI